MLRAEASELVCKLCGKISVKLKALLFYEAIQTKHLSADLIQQHFVRALSADRAAELICAAALTIVGALVKRVIDTSHFQYPFIFRQVIIWE